MERECVWAGAFATSSRSQWVKLPQLALSNRVANQRASPRGDDRLAVAWAVGLRLVWGANDVRPGEEEGGKGYRRGRLKGRTTTALADFC